MQNYIFLLFFALLNLGYAGDGTFVACTSDFSVTSSISPEKFDSVSLPIKLGKLVLWWGPAYRSKNSGSGTMYWRCTDGRVAMAGPVDDPAVILYGNPKQGSGSNWLAFISKSKAGELQLFPITISPKVE